MFAFIQIKIASTTWCGFHPRSRGRPKNWNGAIETLPILGLVTYPVPCTSHNIRIVVSQPIWIKVPRRALCTLWWPKLANNYNSFQNWVSIPILAIFFWFFLIWIHLSIWEISSMSNHKWVILRSRPIMLTLAVDLGLCPWVWQPFVTFWPCDLNLWSWYCTTSSHADWHF